MATRVFPAVNPVTQLVSPKGALVQMCNGGERLPSVQPHELGTATHGVAGTALWLGGF